MKKLLSLAAVVLCLSTCFIHCFAASDIIFTLKAEQPQKENISLSVNVSKDSALYTTEFYIHFNADEVEFIESKFTAGEIVAELDPYFSATEVSEGKVKVSYTSTNPLDSAGELCKLEFRAKEDSFAYFNIEIEHAETFDGEEIRTLTTQGENTSLTIKKQPAVNLIVIIVSVCAVIAAAAVAIAVIKNKKSGNKKKGKKKKS